MVGLELGCRNPAATRRLFDVGNDTALNDLEEDSAGGWQRQPGFVRESRLFRFPDTACDMEDTCGTGEDAGRSEDQVLENHRVLAVETPRSRTEGASTQSSLFSI